MDMETHEKDLKTCPEQCMIVILRDEGELLGELMGDDVIASAATLSCDANLVY